MASGLVFTAADPADIPTPTTGKVTVFFNTLTGVPSYKDDTGTVSPLGTQGSQGPAGPPGAAGRSLPSWFP